MIKCFCTFAICEEVETVMRRMKWCGIEPHSTKKLNIFEKMYLCLKARMKPIVKPSIYVVTAYTTQEKWNEYTTYWSLIPIPGKES